MRYDFEHYLMAGHGRAYMIAKSDPEKYRDRIIEICRDDYSYDLQSEGSRAWLTYDLISLYEDQEPFLAAIKESYSDPSTDTNWERIQYLTDLLLMYDRKVVFAKYKEVEKQIHAEKPLDEIHDLLQSFEYLAISLIQNHGIKVLGSVMRDIGRWFLTRNPETGMDSEV
ncbi:MAG: hypothetical protein J5636_01635 [Clostridiales bacterium]|nr:hypothetical protein [Clostridiales bacterium]